MLDILSFLLVSFGFQVRYGGMGMSSGIIVYSRIGRGWRRKKRRSGNTFDLGWKKSCQTRYIRIIFFLYRNGWFRVYGTVTCITFPLSSLKNNFVIVSTMTWMYCQMPKEKLNSRTCMAHPGIQFLIFNFFIHIMIY